MTGGMPLVILSCLGFSAASLLVKSLGAEIPASWVVFARCAAPLPLLAWLMRREGLAFRSPRWPKLLQRGFWGILAVFCYFWSLPRMPLADATLLLHTSPIYAWLWGVLFMGETFSAGAAACTAACFAGTALVVGPSFASLGGAPYLAAAPAGFFNSLSLTSVKSLSKSEPPARIVLYASLAGAMAFAPGALLSGTRPDGGQWARMAAVGLALTGAQLSLAAGLATTPVTRAAGGTLFTFVFNVLFGWLLWGERPGARSLAGCALVAAGVAGLSAARGPLRRP